MKDIGENTKNVICAIIQSVFYISVLSIMVHCNLEKRRISASVWDQGFPGPVAEETKINCKSKKVRCA